MTRPSQVYALRLSLSQRVAVQPGLPLMFHNSCDCCTASLFSLSLSPTCPVQLFPTRLSSIGFDCCGETTTPPTPLTAVTGLQSPYPYQLPLRMSSNSSGIVNCLRCQVRPAVPVLHTWSWISLDQLALVARWLSHLVTWTCVVYAVRICRVVYQCVQHVLRLLVRHRSSSSPELSCRP